MDGKDKPHHFYIRRSNDRISSIVDIAELLIFVVGIVEKNSFWGSLDDFIIFKKNRKM